jgi:hypothetical protein
MDQQRHKRLRLLISKLNKQRKKQAKKIDILCNDFIAAQRDFIERLNAVSFAADFYQSVIGLTDLSKLLHTVSKLIKQEVTHANVTFFLRQSTDCGLKDFTAETAEIAEPELSFNDYLSVLSASSAVKKSKLHTFESEKPIGLEDYRLENCFTAELVEQICKANKLCNLDDMFAMGLQGNLVGLSKVSAVTVPLGDLGQSLGFILIYRSSENKLTTDELSRISAIRAGLARAIQACQVLLRSTP